MSTKFLTKEQAEKNRKWVLIDGTDQIVGRLSTRIAHILRGKHKPDFTPNQDCGDFVIVVNADKVVYTGNKEQDKLFRHHTGYVSGLKEIPAYKMRETFPERIIERTVKGMLPKSTLGRNMIDKLKIYAGNEHPHQAQKPVALEN